MLGTDGAGQTQGRSEGHLLITPKQRQGLVFRQRVRHLQQLTLSPPSITLPARAFLKVQSFQRPGE